METLIISYKKGWYGRFRKLKIYSDQDDIITEIKQGEEIEVEIPINCKFIYGKMDWGKTEKFLLKNLSRENILEITPYFTFNLLRDLGICSIPIKFNIK